MAPGCPRGTDSTDGCQDGIFYSTDRLPPKEIVLDVTKRKAVAMRAHEQPFASRGPLRAALLPERVLK